MLKPQEARQDSTSTEAETMVFGPLVVDDLDVDVAGAPELLGALHEPGAWVGGGRTARQPPGEIEQSVGGAMGIARADS